ncbi:MAG: YggS family pyridoxal phosphate-dependent enzyme [Elusimicrobia bacterium CG06_land_8_20_14_3_00_38_11]|nr:MAG: YggS family pyridoxal phosphate-dependent enzyme [Elusimicrobia bacterium CG06_land_8_20_14_3_00_38_11]
MKIILERIEKAKNKVGLKKDIKLVAVTKTVPIDKIIEAIGRGITIIGENRIQEAEKKFREFPETVKVEKHLIGHLQTNKVKKAVELFDLIQSVDSIYLLEEINRQAEKIKKIQECFIEIKVSQEKTKYGLNPTELEGFMVKAEELKNIKITGLMAIAPYFENPELVRPYFHRAKEIFEQVRSHFLIPASDFPILSMGMTGDFEIAIEEGSNMVRIGTGIFGE